MPETASDAPVWAVEPLERTLRWALGLRRADGALICPEHGLEHTGKSANVAILALELWRLTGRQQWLDAAVEQGRRLVARLEREGTSPCFTFRPGRHDPFNCSNSVIDGGACSDALASLVLGAGEHLDPTDARNFAHASVLHARTYLRYAAVDKGVPAQRAWALTGIARALEVESAHSDWLAGESMAPGDGVLREAGLEAVSQLAAVQHPDGSYPYHPLEWGAGHPGAADVSSFYQSRVTAFLLHAQPTLGMPEITPELERGLDFLAGLQGPDGIKVGAVEAKPWYWGAEEEVASHPFDVFALAEGGHRAGRADWLAAAERAHRAWGELLTDEGRPRSHRNGPGRRSSYQCSLFWASHACWAARGVGRFGVDALPTSDTSSRHWREVDLVRIESDALVAWVRGKRSAGNRFHGSPLGGLVRVVDRRRGVELLPRRRFDAHATGEWNARAGSWRLGRGWSAGSAELRFSLWLSRVHWRAGRHAAAISQPLRTFDEAVLAFASSECSTAFDREPVLEFDGAGCSGVWRLCWRDGNPVPGSAVERRWAIVDGALEVTEQLKSAGEARGAAIEAPVGVEVVEASAERLRYRIVPS